MRKWRRISHTVRKRGEYIDKRSIGLETTGNRKERKTEVKLEKDRFGGSRKMWQNRGVSLKSWRQ